MGRSEQLQVRLTSGEKEELRRRARAAGMDMSAYVLARTLPPASRRAGAIMDSLQDSTRRRFALAELSDLLAELAPFEFDVALGEEEFHDLDDVRFLLRLLDISTVDGAMRIVTLYFDDSQLEPKTRLALEEILES